LGGVDAEIYAGQVEPYEDSRFGRLACCPPRSPIAAYYANRNPKLRMQVSCWRRFYGIAIRKGDEELKRDRLTSLPAHEHRETERESIEMGPLE